MPTSQSDRSPVLTSGPGALVDLLRRSEAPAPGAMARHAGDPPAQTLAALARHHGVGSLLFRELQSGAGAGPGAQAICQDLYPDYRLSLARSLLWEREALAAVRALQAGGVEPIILKGCLLAADLYGDAAARLVSDVDLLVRPADRLVAGRLLEGAGYVYEPDGFGRSRSRVESLCGAMAFRSLDDTPVDLHWHLVPFWRLRRLTAVDETSLWERAQERNLGRCRVLALGLEDTLLYFCLHLAVNHQYRGLVGYLDLDRLVRQQQLDWETIARRAGQWRIRMVVHSVLRLSAHWLGTPVPPETLAELRPPWWRTSLLWPWTRRQNVLAANGRGRGRFLDRMVPLLLAERLRDLLRSDLSLPGPGQVSSPEAVR